MIRTICFIVLLLIATIWLPLSVQLILYVVGIIIVPQRILLLIPAVFADAYYGPTGVLAIASFKTTITISVLLILFSLISTRTRIKEWYGLEKA